MRLSALTALVLIVSCMPFERDNPFDPSGTSYVGVSVEQIRPLAAYDFVRLEWDAIPGAIGYEVKRYLNPDAQPQLTQTTDAAHFDDNGVQENTTYIYRVVVIYDGDRRSQPTEIVVDVPIADIRLLYPKGGESLAVGLKVTIEWQVVDVNIQSVVIRLSLDGGNSFGTISPSPIESGIQAFDWTPTVDQVSAACMIAIQPPGEPDRAVASQAFEIHN